MRRRKGRIHKWMTIFAGGVSGVVFFAAVSVMAMEFGGFDVEIGTGEYQGDSFWEQGTSAPQNGNGQTYPGPMQEAPSPTEQNPEWNQGEFREDFWMEETPSYNGQIFPEPDYIRPLPPEPEVPLEPAIPQGSLSTPLPAATPTAVLTPTVIPTPSVTPTPSATPTPSVTLSPTPSPKPYSTSAAEEPFQYYRRNVKNRNKMEVKVTELKFPVSAKVKRAEIRVRAKGWVQVLSLRVNNKETDWRWEKDVLVIEQEEIPEDSEIKILIVTEENDGSHSVIAEYCEGDFCA